MQFSFPKILDMHKIFSSLMVPTFDVTIIHVSLVFKVNTTLLTMNPEYQFYRNY